MTDEYWERIFTGYVMPMFAAFAFGFLCGELRVVWDMEKNPQNYVWRLDDTKYEIIDKSP